MTQRCWIKKQGKQSTCAALVLLLEDCALCASFLSKKDNSKIICLHRNDPKIHGLDGIINMKRLVHWLAGLRDTIQLSVQALNIKSPPGAS